MKRLCLILSLSVMLVGCGSTKAAETKTTTATTQTTNQVGYYFSQAQGHPEQQLIQVISGAKTNLDIAIYSITKKEIVDAVIDAKKRGVAVRLISDKTESGGKYQKEQLARLKSAGIPIKINTHKGLMHLKVTIADNNIITTGSYNYTDGATKDNDEVLVVLHDTQAVTDFKAQFERMWNDTKEFKSY